MRVALAVAAAALWLAAPGAAQERPPDVPSGDATLSGRVVNDQRPDAGAGVGIILYSLSPSGEPGLRQTRADETGAFTFEGISNDPGVVYLVGTRVGGVPFGARVSFEAGETRREVEVRVSDPSPHAADVQVQNAQIRLQRGCRDLRVEHRHPLRNDTDRVVFVPPEERDGAEPLLELLLPEGASAIETPLGDALEGFDREGRRLRYWGPVYPGRSGVEFGYGVPLAPRSTLHIGFPHGSDELHVLTPVGGVRVSGDSLGAAEEVALENGPHRSQAVGPIAPGGELVLDVEQAETAEPDALKLSEARIWLELDDAALDVSEQYELATGSQAPLESPSDAPLLCVDLPAEASGLRFSNASLEMGLSRDPSGALALYGPIPPGGGSLSLRYRLPAHPGSLPFSREFSREVPLLTLLVADTGLIAESSRLHRRRPVRTEDRAYLHLEGFGIEPGETVSVALTPIRERHGLSTLASSGFVLLAGLSALLFLIAPLRSPAAPAAEAAPEPGISTERLAVYQAIEALDEDFETGKLTEEDHTRMRGELRARAVALLREERKPPEKPAQAAERNFCTRCGARVEASYRFCAQCGAPLDAEPAA